MGHPINLTLVTGGTTVTVPVTVDFKEEWLTALLEQYPPVHAAMTVVVRDEAASKLASAALGGWTTEQIGYLNEPISGLELNYRTHMLCANADLVFVWQLVERTEAEILCTKNFGRKSMRELKEILWMLKLEIGSARRLNPIRHLLKQP